MSTTVMRICKLVSSALALALAVGSCGKVAEGNKAQFDSNTNWLMRCSDDDQCTGSLRCYCGICTKPCGQDAECGLLSGAQCAESGETLCGEQASAGGLCVLGCTESSECGADFNCTAGQCVPIPVPVPAPLACNGPGLSRDWDTVYQIINNDLAGEDIDDSFYLRYFDLGAGSGDRGSDAAACDARLDAQRHALAKLINSLSIDASVSPPLPIDVDERLYRIDLRDYQWDRVLQVGGVSYADAWEALVAQDPYAIPFSGDDADDAVADTGTPFPLLLVDSFVAAATQPSIYYALLDIPERIESLLVDELQVDVSVAANFEAGFVEEVEFLAQTWPLSVRAGYLWMISDFGREPGALFANPLARPLGDRELVFTLANGLNAFAFMSADGRRLDSWTVTEDRREPGGLASVPRANLRRHPRTLAVRDEVADYVAANTDQVDPNLLPLIRQRFPGPLALAQLLERDHVAFEGPALIRLGVPDAPDGPEPIQQSVSDFERDVSLEVAAAELMITPQLLRENLGLLHPALAALEGGAVPRSVFTDQYLETVCQLSSVLENQPDPFLCP